MPSPFPGMDPYLEAPYRWNSVHHNLITFIAAELNALLPNEFAASPEERRYVVSHQRSIFPDVPVYQKISSPQDRGGRGGTAVLDRADEPHIAIIEPEEYREPFIEVVSVGEPRKVVTVIEVLSYANKGANREGRELYLRKQSELPYSDIGLLEIDLLRRGTHTVSVPEAITRGRFVYDYLACLHRGRAGGRFDYWTATMRDRLPKLPVPLTEGHPDAVLDLQAAFDRTYDVAAFARLVDYSADCPVPLSAEDASWANALLIEKGLRAAQ